MEFFKLKLKAYSRPITRLMGELIEDIEGLSQISLSLHLDESALEIQRIIDALPMGFDDGTPDEIFSQLSSI